ncbi:hypothetical protein MMC28_000007 [Mycoblastus sanguinarius]|nr:hypothetical protein [Mycoblastus sanguinarius]
MNVEMYALAGKYEVRGLKEVVVAKVKLAMRAEWPSVWRHSQSPASDLVARVSLVYSSTTEANRGLRDCAVAHTQENWNVTSCFLDIEAVIREKPVFVMDIMAKKFSTPSSPFWSLSTMQCCR